MIAFRPSRSRMSYERRELKRELRLAKAELFHINCSILAFCAEHGITIKEARRRAKEAA